MENNSRNNMPIDHLKKGDLELYWQSVGELNGSLYSKLKKVVKFLRIVDSYLLSSKSIDKCLGNAILLCIYLVLFFVACKLSLSNFQTLLFVYAPPVLLIQLSLSYIFLKEELALTSWNTLIKLPNFIIYKIREHCLLLSALGYKNLTKIPKFLLNSSQKAYIIPFTVNFIISIFYYYFQDFQFDNLLTVTLLVISVCTITSIICTKIDIYEDGLNESTANKISIFLISFICSIGTLKSYVEQTQTSEVEKITITFIVALYLYYKLFKK